MADHSSASHIGGGAVSAATSPLPTTPRSFASSVSQAAWISSAVSQEMASGMPSLRSLSKFVLGSAQILMRPAHISASLSPFASCPNPQLSCHNTTVVSNTCCFNAPGGELLQTQFWDANPSTGPADSWTIHGLWPDHCDGSYDANCDKSREYSNITDIIEASGKSDLLQYMQTFWKDVNGDDNSFWEHEWNKHGTCVSTLEPKCYSDYKPQEEVVEFFQKTVDLFKTLDTYQILAASGIVPSTDKTYTSADIQAAISKYTGRQATLGCRGNRLNEVWYHYNVQGSVQSGAFIPSDPDGPKSSCPARGVRYLPKATSKTKAALQEEQYEHGQSSAQVQVSAKAQNVDLSDVSQPLPAPGNGFGYLIVRNVSPQRGCLDDNMEWVVNNQCGMFTQKWDGDSFYLSSRRGNCGPGLNQYMCGYGVQAAKFNVNQNGELTSMGSPNFYASRVPAPGQAVPITRLIQSTSIRLMYTS